MTISVIVPAAGCGARAALNGNKILAPVLGKPLLWHTLRALSSQTEFGGELSDTSSTRYAEIIEIVVAVRDEERAIVQQIYAEVESELSLTFVRGGNTRAASVHGALNVSRGDFVLVHDAARPCMTREITARVIESALQNNAAIAALPVDDTVKHIVKNDENGTITIAETLDRSAIYLAQTPQMFRRDLLKNAFEFAKNENWQGTDCASYIEHWAQCAQNEDRVLDLAFKGVAVVRGDASNLKVTYAADVARAAEWLSASDVAKTNAVESL